MLMFLQNSTEAAPKTAKPSFNLQKAAMAAFAAISISGSTLTVVPEAVDAFVPSSTTMVAEKVIREGIYREYEVDVQPQQYDDARSTFKPAKETKSKKGKHLDAVSLSRHPQEQETHTTYCREIHCTSRHSHCWYDTTKNLLFALTFF